MRRLVQVPQKGLARLRLHLREVHLLGVRAKLRIADTRFGLSAARPVVLQLRGLATRSTSTSACATTESRARLTVRNCRVVRAHARQLGATHRHRAITLASNRVNELAVLASRPSHRLLPRADNVDEPLVARSQSLQHFARTREQRNVRRRPLLRPCGCIEEVLIGLAVRQRQQVIQTRKSAEHFSRQRLRSLRLREPRNLANDRVHTAQREHRRERAAIRRSQQHDALDVRQPFARHRRATDEPAHAVPDDHHAGLLSANTLGQSAPDFVDAQSPVVVVEHRREAGDPQMQLQPQIRVEHHAQRNDLRFLR